MTDTKEVAIRGGTQAEQDAFTGVLKEVTFDTTNLRLRLHDQINPGGMSVPNRRDAQNGAFVAATAGGTANALTLDFGLHNPVAYAKFQRFVVEAASNNNATATLNVGGLGNVGLRKVDRDGAKQELEAADLVAGRIYEVTHDGSHFVVNALASGGGREMLISQAVASTSSAINIALPGGYDLYRIEVINGLLSTAGDILLRTSVDGGSSFATTSYQWHAFRPGEAGALQTAQSAVTLVTFQRATDADDLFHGTILLFNPSKANDYTQIRGDFVGRLNGTLNMRGTLTFGARAVKEAVNAVRLLPSTGTFTSGTFRLWGLKNN